MIVETLLRLLKTRAIVFRIMFKTSISPKPNLDSAFSPQDSDVGPMGGGIDVLGFETGHGCAGVRVRGLHHIFQVDDNIPFLDLVDKILIDFFPRRDFVITPHLNEIISLKYNKTILCTYRKRKEKNLSFHVNIFYFPWSPPTFKTLK